MNEKAQTFGGTVYLPITFRTFLDVSLGDTEATVWTLCGKHGDETLPTVAAPGDLLTSS